MTSSHYNTHDAKAMTAHPSSHTPTSTLAFDWVYTALVFLVTIGIYMDGWSHSSFGPDQSVSK